MNRPNDVRARLEARFRATVDAAGGIDWPLALPPALRETMIGAARLEGGECPPLLADFYTGTMPRMLVEQLREEPLLWRRLDPGRTPRLREALDGLFAALRAAQIDPLAFTGADSPDVLFAARPSVAELFQPMLFGSGLPMVGAYPAERALLARELAAGADPDALIDLRLSGNLVHEICHGLRREAEAPPPPWMVLESAAIHLGMTARAAHVFPDDPGEAVPGVSLFVLVGEGLARLFGAPALWRASLGASLSAMFGERAAGALAVAGWQDWLRRKKPPFTPDALDALGWIKLADATRASTPLDPLLDRAAQDDPFRAARELPPLVAAADAVPWSALPWSAEEPGPLDEAMAGTAVRALFQVNCMAPTFQTHPAEPPGGRLVLDVGSCVLSAARRPEGVFGEPARWLFPPPLARRIAGRGARKVRIEGATRTRALEIAAALLTLSREKSALPAETVL